MFSEYCTVCNHPIYCIANLRKIFVKHSAGCLPVPKTVFCSHMIHSNSFEALHFWCPPLGPGPTTWKFLKKCCALLYCAIPSTVHNSHACCTVLLYCIATVCNYCNRAILDKGEKNSGTSQKALPFPRSLARCTFAITAA